MDFARRKSAALAALSSPAPDKSPKGGVDAPIAPLLEVLNSHPDLFTTSSCSGRVSVLAQPQEGQGQGAAKPKKKARGGGWVYVSHEPADPDAVVEQLFGGSGSAAAGDELVFRFEPMIVAVECRDSVSAAALVAAAISAGFRESGITSLQKRAIVAIRCSIRMEVPLGQTDQLVVSPEYIRYLVRIANCKMEANKKRMDGFLDLLQTKGLSGLSDSCNGSSSQPIDHRASLGLEVKIPLDKGAKINDDCLVKKRRNGRNNCHADDRGASEIGEVSLEAQYFENQDSTWSKGVEHGFEMILKEFPSPRLGHTLTSVGNSTYVIGGRGGPSEILDDVWVLQSSENTWLRLECSGNTFRPRWETLGDIIILPKTCFKDPLWESVSEELWPLVSKSLGAQRLARQGKIMPNGTRDSTLELLLGDNGWVTHHENGIRYSLDATKCMFSSGNRSEKLRMGQLNCKDEVVVDLFAGIGYFVLPFLVKANAKFVYACEWNPHALEALRRNVRDNHVQDRCLVLEGDNRVTAPKGVADRVCLGLLPSSECSWDTAVASLRPK
nr:unnamed protein product [Digitaria exilis]